MTSPTVSVIIPVRDRAGTVGLAIRSALGQTMSDLEVILVDDNSSDDIEGALATIADPRLRVFRQPRRVGAAAARNFGIHQSRGRFIAFLDSDDEWFPDKLSRQLEVVEGAPTSQKTFLCVSGCLLDRGDGAQERHTPPAMGDLRSHVLAGKALNMGSTALIDRAAFLEIGGFDETLFRLEDWDWLLRYSMAGGILPVPSPLAVIHVRGRPAATEVGPAIATIWAKHASLVAREGGRPFKRFRSGIALETAFSAFLDGRYRTFLAETLSALFMDPRLSSRLFKRLIHRIPFPPRHRGKAASASRSHTSTKQDLD